jgi:hypothetical protein
LVFALLLIILTFETSKEEHLDNSNEAVQSLASVYNTGNAVLGDLKVNNLIVTGTASVADTLSVGSNVKMYGKSDSQDKMQIFKNGDGKAPYLYFNKAGGFGIWDGTKSPFYLDDSGNFSMYGDLTFDGSNKWILHTPNDGRTTMYVAPLKNNNWDWNNATEFNNNGVVNVITNGPVGFIGDGGGQTSPLFIGQQGRLNEIFFPINAEDWVALAPKCGLKLWDVGPAPDYNSDGTWKAENTSSNWTLYNLWGSNRMDYFKVYKL